MVTAEEFYGTSLDVCRYLVDSLALQEKLDQV